MYNSAQWQHTRLAKLQHSPLCERCLAEGRTTPASDVHHIVSFADKGDDMMRYALDIDNLMSLCKTCHGAIHEEQNKKKICKEIKILRR